MKIKLDKCRIVWYNIIVSGEILMAKLGYCKKGLEALLSPGIKQIAWAAGIYEGEGSVAKNASVSVTQKDKWVLHQLILYFGGTLSTCGNRGIYQWHISGARARGFLMTIFTFLSPRRKERIKEVLV